MIQRISHWNFQYIYSRIKLFFLERKYTDEPWLVHEANEFIDKFLQRDFLCVEWGSGRSTKWLALRCQSVISIEHNDEWYEKVSNSVKSLGNVRLLNRELSESYIDISYELDDNSVNMCLVDGRLRSKCAISIADKIKPGGILVIDNIDRYIPTSFATPCRRDDYASVEWQDFHCRMINSWEERVFSNGVTSTAIWVKPHIN